MVSLLVRPMLFSILFLNTDGTKTTQEGFFSSKLSSSTQYKAFSLLNSPGTFCRLNPTKCRALGTFYMRQP